MSRLSLSETDLATLRANTCDDRAFRTLADLFETRINEAAHANEQPSIRDESPHPPRDWVEFMKIITTRLEHEFRTPLSIIHTSIDILQRYYEHLPPEKRSQQYDKVRCEVSHLTSLLDGMNFIIRAKAGAYLPQASVVDLLTFCLDVLRYTHATKGRLIIPEIAPDVRSWMIDGEVFTRILRGLILHAIRYSEPPQPIHVRAWRESNTLILEVADYGISFRNEALNSVVDPFRRSVRIDEKSEVDEKSGVDLELTLASEATHLLNGSISIDTVPDIGTTVIVRVPQMIHNGVMHES